MRHSSRTSVPHAAPYRIQTLFHSTNSKNYLPKKMEVLHNNPNVYLVREFLTESEIEYFDKICTDYSNCFEASFTESESQVQVVSEERTSNYIHLTKSQDKFVRSIEQKAADMVGLSSQSVEPLQIVSYTDGQKFELHHDAGTLQDDGSIEIICPRRLVTFFVYLNNLPIDHGHTGFPELGLSVKPERGCAVLFCNVLPNGTADPRTVHCAEPVASGLWKYGVNIWLCDCNLQELSEQKPTYTINRDTLLDKEISVLSKAEKLTEEYRYRQRQQSMDENNVNEQQQQLIEKSPLLVNQHNLVSSDSDGYWHSTASTCFDGAIHSLKAANECNKDLNIERKRKLASI